MIKHILFFCIFPSILFCKTLESPKMSSLLESADAETWIFCDIDNTLIESAFQIGSAQWRNHIRKKAIHAGYGVQKTEEVVDAMWVFVQPFVTVRTVDPETTSILQELKQGHLVLALTAREPIECGYTSEQFSSVDIDLSNDLLPENLCLDLPHPNLYKSGIIYCGENKKSAVLLALFEKIGSSPKRIVFIDDKWEQVIELEKSLKKLNIEYIGIRFSGADERVKAFQAPIADLQWSLLPHVISDEKAAEMLKIQNRN